MNKINISQAVMILLIGIMLVSSVKASGVSSSYWEGESADDPDANPLIMYPGEVKEFTFSLQNSMGSQNESVRVSVSNGGELVSLKDSNNIYLVPAGSADVPVVFVAKVPSDAKTGEQYNINLEFSGSPVSENGQFQFGSSIVKKFNLVVKDKVLESVSNNSNTLNNNLIVILIIAVLAVAIVIWYVKRKRK